MTDRQPNQDLDPEAVLAPEELRAQLEKELFATLKNNSGFRDAEFEYLMKGIIPRSGHRSSSIPVPDVDGFISDGEASGHQIRWHGVDGTEYLFFRGRDQGIHFSARTSDVAGEPIQEAFTLQPRNIERRSWPPQPAFGLSFGRRTGQGEPQRAQDPQEIAREIRASIGKIR